MLKISADSLAIRIDFQSALGRAGERIAECNGRVHPITHRLSVANSCLSHDWRVKEPTTMATPTIRFQGRADVDLRRFHPCFAGETGAIRTWSRRTLRRMACQSMAYQSAASLEIAPTAVVLGARRIAALYSEDRCTDRKSFVEGCDIIASASCP
jgi:hypothetical protein